MDTRQLPKINPWNLPHMELPAVSAFADLLPVAPPELDVDEMAITRLHILAAEAYIEEVDAVAGDYADEAEMRALWQPYANACNIIELGIPSAEEVATFERETGKSYLEVLLAESIRLQDAKLTYRAARTTTVGEARRQGLKIADGPTMRGR